MVGAAPPTLPTLPVPGRGRAGATRPDGSDGAFGPPVLRGTGALPACPELGRGRLRVAFSEHLVHRYGARGPWCCGTPGGRSRRAMPGVLQRPGGRRTGGGGAQRLRPPDPQGLRRSLCARGGGLLCSRLRALPRPCSEITGSETPRDSEPGSRREKGSLCGVGVKDSPITEKGGDEDSVAGRDF